MVGFTAFLLCFSVLLCGVLRFLPSTNILCFEAEFNTKGLGKSGKTEGKKVCPHAAKKRFVFGKNGK